jgi:hypothetical protein
MIVAAFLAPLLVTAFPNPVKAADIGLSVRIGDRYRGDRLAFTTQPRMQVVPNTHVYYIQDSDRDVYQYGRTYYANDGGRWYRAQNYRGPWIYVRSRNVPRQIYAVPAGYRRGWQGDYGYWRHRDYDRNWDQRGQRQNGQNGQGQNDQGRQENQNRGNGRGN